MEYSPLLFMVSIFFEKKEKMWQDSSYSLVDSGKLVGRVRREERARQRV